MLRGPSKVVFFTGKNGWVVKGAKGDTVKKSVATLIDFLVSEVTESERGC